jgi:hypothetical protein
MKNHENEHYKRKGDILWLKENYDAEWNFAKFFYPSYRVVRPSIVESFSLAGEGHHKRRIIAFGTTANRVIFSATQPRTFSKVPLLLSSTVRWALSNGVIRLQIVQILSSKIPKYWYSPFKFNYTREYTIN